MDSLDRHDARGRHSGSTTLAGLRRAAVWTGVVLLLAPLAVAAQGRPSVPETRTYRLIDSSTGLSQNFVTAIAQDSDGFMWFGTLGALDRFDGRRIETYRHDPADAGSLSAGEILALHADVAGRLWVGTRSGLDRYEPESNTFSHHGRAPSNSGGLASGPAKFITSDRDGQIWFGSMALNRLDPETGSVVQYDLDGRELTLLHIDDANRLWVATSVLDPASGGTRETVELMVFADCGRLPTDALPAPDHRIVPPAETGRFVAIAVGDSDQVWLGQEDEGGLTRFDPGSGTLSSPWTDSVPVPLARGNVRGLTRDASGTLWAVAGAPRSTAYVAPPRLYRIDRGSVEATAIDLRARPERSGTDAPMESLATDRFGGLWITTNAGGLLHVDVAAGGFGLFRPTGELGMDSGFVRAVHGTRDGTLWIGTPGGLAGLARLDPLGGFDRRTAYEPIRVPPLPAPDVRALFGDRTGALWIGTSGGLVQYELATGRLRHFRSNPADPDAPADDIVQVIHQDTRNTLWFGVGARGLDALAHGTTRFLHFRYVEGDPASLPSDIVQALFSDSAGRLWVGTANGLAVAEPAPAADTRFRRVPLAGGAADGSVLCIHEKPSEPGVLWLGRQARGLARLDVSTGAVRHFTTRNSALADDTVYGILEDRDGGLWMSTNRGLTRFDSDAGTFETFGIDRGLQSLEFNAQAYFQAADGQMFFGGVAGLNAFYPDTIRPNTFPPQPRIKGISALDRSAGESMSPFRQVYRLGMSRDSLVLSPDQRDLRFDLVALHFSDADRNRFVYRLDNYDEAWREPASSDEAVYTNLEPGRYRFRLRAISSHGVWSETDDSVAFVIRAPFYATGWFVGLCVLGALGLMVGGYAWRVGTLRRRQQSLERAVEERTEELRRALATVERQARDLEDLDAAKSRFFANVSHEFRTPLTLSLGPLEDLRSGRHGSMTPDAVAEVDRALVNTRRQLKLVDQLLSLAAIDAGKLRLDARWARLDDLVKVVVSEFEGHSQRQAVALRLELPPEATWASFDEEKIRQVLGNLLSNACRFTPSGGRILVRLRSRDETVALDVEDTGVGIPEENLPQVFERFYRSDREHRGRPGTGIGLSLCKELVELHGGTIRAESTAGLGSRFTVELPRGEMAAEPVTVRETPEWDTSVGADEGAEPVVPESLDAEPGPGPAVADEPREDDRPKVLVVEDHPDMRAYLEKHLQEHYRVVTAGDGASGLRCARDEMPDLVVSDVMMSGMDGYELCAALRKDRELEHVPVVFLTARADLESKIEGLEHGADVFLSKPFNRRELLATVHNILQARERLRTKLRDEFRRRAVSPGPADVPSANDALLARVREVLERRSFEDAFSIGELSRELGMSRSQLHRRLSELLDKSPSEVLMEWRLERAAQLLDRRAGNVAEVAFAVGFKNVSHFVRRFRKQFGKTPAAYAASRPSPS